jgi:asparagine synthase (glutamine-hydrolysing)
MCGIAGFVAKPGRFLPNLLIQKMVSTIYHRGPDDEGFILLDENKQVVSLGGDNTPAEVWEKYTEYRPTVHIGSMQSGKSSLAFGHKRLSILDLSPSGHQPMSYDNGRYWIVFNGEIYNYREINMELEGLKCSFKTSSDVETILAAYSVWGERCLERFVGMWAFVIYDRDSDELFMARDRYGIKPVYYYFSPEGDLFFGSEIKQFTQLDKWQAKINRQRVYDQIVYSFTDHTDETLFEGVYQIPPGCSHRLSLKNFHSSDTGKLPYKRWYEVRHTPFKGSYSEASSAFKVLFERAVKEHLYADVPVGTALSGGLDSSSIVCQVNRFLSETGSNDLQRTFSSCSTTERYSEKKWIDIVTNHTAVNSRIIYPQLDEIYGLTEDLIWYHDEPYQSQSAFLAYNVFKLAKNNGIKVLLNGQGADEYLGGYGQFTIPRMAFMLKKLRFSALLSEMEIYKSKNSANYPKILSTLGYHLSPLFVRRILSDVRSNADHVKEVINLKKLGIAEKHPYDSIPVNYNTIPEISRHLTFYSTLPKYLRWEDRNSMANSVEARVPFLDHRLVEFTYNLPDDFLESKGTTKRIMRDSLKGLLPEQIRNRGDKMGFTTPEELWVRSENPSYFREKISDAIEITNGIIKPEALKYYDNLVNGSIPFDYTYWRLILFSEWIKKFKVAL